MTDDVLKRFEVAVDTFDNRIHQVPDGRWSAPTPCAEWNVRAVVNHVVGEHLWAGPLLEGRTVAEVGDAFEGDLLGADPCAAWHHASGLAHTAMAADGALTGTVHLSYGDESAVGYCEQMTFDALIHAWDVAKGAGLDARLPAGLVDWAHAWVVPMLAPMQAAGLFAASLEVGPDADAQTRLLARLGRS
jgi:uncharacterized protein (TIGR03086 family)